MALVKRAHLIALVGGTGFIGRAVSAALRARGHRVRLVARHAPGKLNDGEEFYAADTSAPSSLAPALTGCTVVVHLVAMLAERGTSFDEVIHQGAGHVARAAQAAGVGHMVYVSALGAGLASPSAYARAKARAEVAVRKVFPKATVIRPSLVMGEGGGFIRQVDLLTRHAPVMVLPGWGTTRFQPVPLGLLAGHIADACLKPEMRNQTVNAVGPDILTFRQLAQAELNRLGRKRILVPLPWWATWLVAWMMTLADRATGHRLIPDWLLVTPDQVRLLRNDNTA